MSNGVRCISLWQPWTELIARELKGWETRDYPCRTFGLTGFHAAQKKFDSAKVSQELRTQLLMDEVDPFWLKYGVVLCVGEIVSCVKVEVVKAQLSARELTYGGYDSTCPWCQGAKCPRCKQTGIIQRYAWRIANVRRLKKPVALKGHQRWFHWDGGRTVLKEQGLL